MGGRGRALRGGNHAFPEWAVFLLALMSACGEGRGSPEQARPDASPEPRPDATVGPADAAVGPLPDEDAGAGNPAYAFPCLGARPSTGEPSFHAVYLEVLCRRGCVAVYCHGSRGTWGGLDLTTIPVAYNALVGSPTGTRVPVGEQPTCRESDMLRVAPGEPEASVMYLKISGKAPCGTAMPPPTSEWSRVPPEEVEQVRRWIELGAPLEPL